MNKNLIYNEDCLIGLKRLPDNSVDCVLTDPPYLYLKGQKLERPFDEDALFAEFDRIVKPTGFVVIFGRGESFYRWNYKLNQIGFKFKEEVIWDKVKISSPTTPLARFHETVSILSKSGKINISLIPYVEQQTYNLDKVEHDLNRIVAGIGDSENLKRLRYLINSTKQEIGNEYILKQCEVKSRFKATFAPTKNMTVDPCVSRFNAIEHGMKERSIMKVRRDKHSDFIHPTQKPVRLMERLLALTTKEGDLVVDPFCGSCPVGIACVNTGRDFIGWEIDKEYFDGGNWRFIDALTRKEA